MKTRSRKNNELDDDRGTDSEDSSYTNSSSKRRKKPTTKISNHLPKYRRTLNLDMTRSRFSEKNLMSMAIKRERRGGDKGENVSNLPAHSTSNQVYVNGNDNVDEKQSVRRSTRRRKFTYDNLNQTWLLAGSIPDFSKLEPLFSSEPPNPNEDQCESEQPRRSERNRNHELRRLGLSADHIEFDDMYSRVKRERRKSVHGFYQRRVSQDVGSMADTEETDHNEMSDSESMDDGSDIEEGIGEEESQENDGAPGSKYSLRPKKPITERFQFPIIERTRPRRSPASNIFELSSHHQRPRERDPFKSPAHRSPLYRRKRHAIHHTSTSSSSDDERRFEKRKARSMARARNRCLPINFCENDLAKGVIRERMKVGSSLADIDPMNIDKTISFDNIGGLDHHIQSLKEMILFPLMYPEVFERFKIAPPRGVLFHGQPGTGKTLVARALANECSQRDRRVAFFMRKGADCLSKWVGESERQLRLLFDQAYQMRPAIIFFDEIDGLAPVRSTRQDQIHSSIVSTLLALMDGLDNRGEIVVIGATNRIDAIDPALRRPGRFDRELLFPLPSLQVRATVSASLTRSEDLAPQFGSMLSTHTKFEARQKILKIIVKLWTPPLPDSLIQELAARSVGYCGADLKALCAEAALVALRRRYPQIYESRQKLQLDVSTIQVSADDFFSAMQKIMPTVQRATVFSPNPLPEVLKPLLERMLQNAMHRLSKIFPVASIASKMAEESGNKLVGNACSSSGCCADVSVIDCFSAGEDVNSVEPDALSRFSRFSRYLWPFVHRPRFLLSGSKGQGQGTLAPAILYILENVPVHRLDVPALYAVTCRAPEEACAHIFQEAQRNLPSIIFLPHVGYWWETLSDTVRATFVSLLHDLEPCIPVMLFATSDCPYFQLPAEVQDIFSISADQVMHMDNPSDEERKKFFSVLLKDMLIPPPEKTMQEKHWEPLPVAPPPEPRKLTDAELEKLRQREEATLRELRLFLREILTKLARDRRFSIFTRPVDPGEVPDYREVIQNPMDLETMMTKIDLHRYEYVAQFLADIDLVCHNALEYNPDRDPSDKLIRHRACALKDTAHALVLSELDVEFEKICQEIHQARKKRGESPSKYVPKSYHVLPRSEAPKASSSYEKENVCDNPGKETKVSEASNNLLPHRSCTTRYSKRIRGLGAPTASELTMKKVDECYVPPKRATQYMIWRRKKSPWFGSCRRKLIRRRVAYADDISSKRIRKSASLTRRKCCKSLSPILETPSQERLKEQSPVKDVSACKQTSKVNSHEDVHSLGGIQRNCRQIRDSSPNSCPEIVYLTAMKEKSSSEITCCSTSRCNTASNCDKNSDCSKIVSNKRSYPLSQEANKAETKVKHESDITASANEDRMNNQAFEQNSSDSRQEVDISKNALESFSKSVVKATDGCTVDTLQQLFSVLQHCIYRHRQEWDKSDLIQDLEKEVKKFCQRSLS